MFIQKMLDQRSPCKHRTDCLFGPPGVGKTTRIHKLLEEVYPALDYYLKKSLSKYWDGYDNQPIVWIDDPIPSQTQITTEQASELKSVISTGPAYVEVKYGNMQFDSRLVILSVTCLLTTSLTFSAPSTLTPCIAVSWTLQESA